MSPTAPDLSARRLRLGRLRAGVPILLALACQAAGVPGGPALLAVGVLGAALVWIEDGHAPLEPWCVRFPSLPWHAVEALPHGAGSRDLVRVCEEIDGTLTALNAARGAPGLDPRSVRRELAGLLALAADLLRQREQLAAMEGVTARRARVDETLASVIPAVRSLRATLQRAAAPGASEHRPRLGSLLTLDRDLRAHQDCLDELEELPCVR